METEAELGRNIKHCPVETALQYIGKKWAMNILRDLFFGKRRFRDFLESNPTMSSKMLSTRLKDLMMAGIVEKRVISTNPVLIEYGLTPTGRALNRTLHELAIFAMEHYPEEVFHSVPESVKPYEKEVKRLFRTP